MNKYTRNTRLAPAATFKSLIRAVLGYDLTAKEIHRLFREIGVKPVKGEYFGTPNVTLYNMNDVDSALESEKERISGIDSEQYNESVIDRIVMESISGFLKKKLLR